MKSFTLFHRTQRIPVIHGFFPDVLGLIEDCSIKVVEQDNSHLISAVYGMLRIEYILIEPTAYNPQYILINQTSGTLVHASTSLFKVLMHVITNLQINY